MTTAAATGSLHAHASLDHSSAAILALRSASAVRERCRMVHDWVAAGHSPHFTVEHGRLAAVADYVAEVTRAAYPDLRIPYHSRWRHFSAGGVDRWHELAQRLPADPIERARAAIDLATVSVLLDAGAGDAWRYREADDRPDASIAPKGLRSRASTCSAPADSRPIRARRGARTALR